MMYEEYFDTVEKCQERIKRDEEVNVMIEAKIKDNRNRGKIDNFLSLIFMRDTIQEVEDRLERGLLNNEIRIYEYKQKIEALNES